MKQVEETKQLMKQAGTRFHGSFRFFPPLGENVIEEIKEVVIRHLPLKHTKKSISIQIHNQNFYI